MKIQFAEAAEAELDEVLRYYERESPGLGAEFLDEIALAVNRIAEFPDAWQKLEPDARRRRLNRFPYGVVYARVQRDIVILRSRICKSVQRGGAAG